MAEAEKLNYIRCEISSSMKGKSSERIKWPKNGKFFEDSATLAEEEKERF